MEDRKSLARILDRAAMRAGDRGATSKQTWFLAGLMVEAGEDGSEYLLSGLPLYKSDASDLIESFLKAQKAAA